MKKILMVSTIVMGLMSTSALADDGTIMTLDGTIMTLTGTIMTIVQAVAGTIMT